MHHSPPSTSHSCETLENQSPTTYCSTFLHSSATSHSLKTIPILLFLSPKEVFISIFIHSNLYSSNTYSYSRYISLIYFLLILLFMHSQIL